MKKVHDNAISVTTDFVGFYPCILLNENLEVLKKHLDNFYEKSIPTWRISFSKMNKFSLGFGSGTLLVNNASEKELDVFLEQRNNFHPNLKFRHEHSREEINFFDVTIRVNHGEFIVSLYCKPTDGHQYLHFESCHPSHTKSSINFSQSLRMRRICSKKSDLVANVRKLKDWFIERGCPEDMVSNETKMALESPSLGRSKTSEKSVSGNCGTRVPLVVTYNPILCRLG